VKSAVLLAGLAAEGETTIEELAATRDHTERALAHLGAPVRIQGWSVTVGAYRHGGFAGTVPGDLSSAAFLVAGAALTGRELVIDEVGLNPSRSHLLEVLGRMGVATEATVEREEVGEPVGRLEVRPGADLVGTTVTAEELPLLIDEVPVLAMLGAHARGETRFEGAGELRVKESDRISALVSGFRALGVDASEHPDGFVVNGDRKPAGGTADAAGDHRLVMAFTLVALGASGPSVIRGADAVGVSYPQFEQDLSRLIA
jgi:3-phosphoshikimate 1-carboxyvinyltransferase